MSMAAIIRELIAAGVLGDDLVAAVERIEHADHPARSKAAERTRRWREKRHETSQNVTVTSPKDSVTVTSQPSQNVTSDANDESALSFFLPIKKEKKERAKRNSGEKLPPDWKPSASHFDEGRLLSFDNQAVVGLSNDMKLWARSNEHRAVARKSNWDMAFSGWMRRASKDKRGSGYKPQRHSMDDPFAGII